MWNLLAFLTFAAAIAAEARNYSNFPCPTKCVCFRRTVRCMKLDLTEIPKTPLQTILLDLRFNRIREIPPGSFKGYKYTRSLLLNNNLLTRLENGAFTGLVQVRHLYLYKNRLRSIEGEVFQGLPRLEHLYLQGNELYTFKDGTFSNLPSLERLFLYNNNIQHLSPKVFNNLPKLSSLRLDQNALICDCKISWLAKMLTTNAIHVVASCKYPSEMYGKPISGMNPEDFHCKPPKITEDPADIEITLGKTAMFTCRVQGDPDPTVVWMKNHEEINVDGLKYSLMEDGSLMIKNTQNSDGGYYECMAKNEDGEAKSRPARMNVISPYQFKQQQDPPNVLPTSETVHTTDGAAEVKLSCNVKDQISTYRWSFNGIQLLASDRHIFAPDGTLTIKPVQIGDHGTYVCETFSHLGRTKAKTTLVINSPPIFTVHPENLETNVGATFRIECAAVGTPQPKITWYKDDAQLGNDNRRQITTDGVLEVKDAKESDSGLYICQASNNLGNREVSARIKIGSLKLKPPKLVYKPYNIEAAIGSTIELPCKAEGDPAPGIQWQKDGASMQRTGRTKISLTGNLYIYNVAPEDQGRYECSAINEHGRDTASGYVTVKELIDPTSYGRGSGDKFVKIAFAEATEEVDKAINNTIDKMFNKKGPHSSAELFRLFRYPDAPTRELARAAEVYERTLSNIRKHIDRGITTNYTTDFNYREILSKDHLELIATLSGCMTHRRYRNCSDMCFHSRYRSIDGTCNNLQNPTWGASSTGFRRILKPIYEDGFSKPVGWDKSRKYYGFRKPLARYVSTELIATETITQDEEITHMVMQWGQFLDHDLDHATPSVSSESWDGIDCKKSCDYAAPCFPMDIPPGDPRHTNRRCIDFVRSAALCGSGMTSIFFDDIQPREQINQLTSYIDASQVYGFSEELSRSLRDLNSDAGVMREGPVFPGRKPLLPYASNEGIDCRRNLSESDVNCFAAGDIRVNEQVGLIAMHTLWMREHNRLARELKHLNPQWDPDMLFHEARKIVGAAMQHITYKHWLPYVIGESGMRILGDYQGYNPSVNPSISNEFATAALRFGHTLINPILHRLDADFRPIREGHLQLRYAFFSPWRIVDEGGIDPLLRGMFTVAAKVKRPTENLNTELTEQLFRAAHAVALDLASMNIQRGRDHAIPGYIEYRKFCNMSPVDSFDDLKAEISDPGVRRKLQEIYGHPGNIDIFVGGILEDPVEGARVGPLFQCILIEQFRRLRDGDRFYYENPSVFKPEQLVQIKQYSLSRVLCENGDNITKITPNVFVLPERQGGFIECSTLPKIDLKLWSQCCSDCRFSGQLNTISRFNAPRSKRQSDPMAISNYFGIQELAERVTSLENVTNILKSSQNKAVDLVKKIPTADVEYIKKLKERVTSLENTVKNLKSSLDKVNSAIEKMKTVQVV